MPEPIIAGMLTAALYRAVEKIWEESAKAVWTPGTNETEHGSICPTNAVW